MNIKSEINIASVNDYVRRIASKYVNCFNSYADKFYLKKYIEEHKMNCYYNLKRNLELFDYFSIGELEFKYNRMVHILAHIKSKVFENYVPIDIAQLINEKISNKIPITIDDFIGVYVHIASKQLESLKDNDIEDYIYAYTRLSHEFMIKKNLLDSLVGKISFKALFDDCNVNENRYNRNRLKKLFNDRYLTSYLSEFI